MSVFCPLSSNQQSPFFTMMKWKGAKILRPWWSSSFQDFQPIWFSNLADRSIPMNETKPRNIYSDIIELQNKVLAKFHYCTLPYLNQYNDVGSWKIESITRLFLYRVLALAETLLQGSRRHLTVVVVGVVGTILRRPRFLEIFCRDFHSDWRDW